MQDRKFLTDSYRTMYKIRRFEENLLTLFSENKLKGTTHTSIGQEADAVAVMHYVRDQDFVFSNHRCHGHFIAYSDDIRILLSEIMGKKNGMCRGRGGSQHICYKHFFTNGVQGGIVPNATGAAFAEKLKKGDGIAVVFLGDGTLGQGVVYESFNMASLYEIPILYVIEDNGYAMTTKTSEGVAGGIIERAYSFGIEASEITSNDVTELADELGRAFRYVRAKEKPFCQVIHTYRLGPHSKGDDFREEEEIAAWKKKDPLLILEAGLEPGEAEKIRLSVEQELADAMAYAKSQEIDQSPEIFGEGMEFSGSEETLLNRKKIKCVESLNKGIRRSMEEMEEVVLLGEDIRDPYGGAFKATKGLTAAFSERIFNTPISEAGFIGLCVGLGLNGMKPVCELMFGDFITLGFDQLLNHATKFNWMYAGQVRVPMLVRVPGGGGRGYGATHSQCLEKYLIGIPNLRVLAFSKLLDTGKFVHRVLKNLDSPTILIENKKMYGERLLVTENGRCGMFFVEESRTDYPVYRLSLAGDEQPDALIITYGQGADTAMKAAERLLMEEEVLVNILVHTSISPIDLVQTRKYAGSIKNILTLEEGTLRAGWGAEIIAELSETLAGRNYARVAAKNCVIPSGAELEERVLPGETEIIETIRRML